MWLWRPLGWLEVPELLQTSLPIPKSGRNAVQGVSGWNACVTTVYILSVFQLYGVNVNSTGA